jgi:GTP-binding protein Era
MPRPKPRAPTKRRAPRPAPSRVATVAIIGRPNVGKSTLLNALVGQPLAITSHHPQTTRERILGVHTEDGLQLVFTDTPGMHAPRNRLGEFMNQEAETAASGGDIVVFVTDVGPKVAAEMRADDLALLRGLPAKARVVLVLNKIDTVKAKSALFPLLEAIGKAPLPSPFAEVIPISAKNQDGTARLIEVLRGMADEGPMLFDDETLSDRPTRFFVAEFVREQLLRKTREEVPHGVAVAVERWSDVKGVPHIELAVIVDKESHKKIVIGRGGALLKEVGTRARAKVESLMGQHVHLKLWVRVVPRWYESPAKLAELGYALTTGTEGDEP